MGISSSRSGAAGGGAKIILADGTVETVEPSTTAGELMLEHAYQLVVDCRPLLAGEKAAALPADGKLSPGGIYLMVPMKAGKAAVLSAIETREAIARVRSILYLSGSPPCWPWVSRSPPAGEKPAKEPSGEVVKSPEISFDVAGEMSELLGRQFSCKGWKPSLHTIEEKALQKEPHWLF